jgi:signal transduction histidine kinase
VTRRLLLGYLGITLFVLVALEVPLGVQNGRSERRDLVAKVTRDATVLAQDAEDAVQSQKPAELSQVATVAYAYAGSTGSRVVVVDRRGYALVDTSGRVAGAESFATRPEIRAALKGGYSVGERTSKTLGTRLLYVAVPIASGGVVHGAVRVTYPTSALDARILHYWLLLAGIAAVVLAAAALVGARLARFVTRPLRGLEQAAAAVGAGDLDARAPETVGPPEVRSLARVFNETVAKLGQLLRAQEEFVADASHELRTPLTALRLRLENGDAEGALPEAERLGELVESLLVLARSDAGASPAERVDPAECIRARVAAWRPLADEHAVRLEEVVNGVVPVRAGPGRLDQVLDNLVSNALDHAPPGSAVTVSAASAPPWVELRVSDQGPGMTAEEQARAFDRFWRAPSSSHPGSGLGLAIVRKLVEVDGGEVELTPAPGGGTSAVVRLRPD